MKARDLLPVLAALTAAPAAHAQTRGVGPEDEIVVVADRPRGSVPGDFVPESTFSSDDIRSYGASSIFQILAALAPHTGSASIRGGGFPIVLVNGRRISGIQEIRDLPPEVISRVEVFDEQLSLQYGYSADQRVVNFVLEQRYSARSAEASGSLADSDARATERVEGRSTEINEGDRLTLGISADSASSITELERGIAPPVAGPDTRAARTLAPEAESWRANASFARALSERVTGNASLRYETSDQTALLGIDGLSLQRLRDSETESLRATAGLDGAIAGWQWTATATADASSQNAVTVDSLSPARTSSDQTLFDLTANANGAIMSVPAGRLRGSFRLGVENRQIESSSIDTLGERRADLERTTPSGRMTLIAPITSRRREFGESFGDITLNTTASWSDPSDFAALSSLGFGASWAPLTVLRFSLQAESSEAAPAIQQLGDPITTTPDVFFFDPVTGEDVLIDYTSGGNPDLAAEEREDVTFNVSWSPSQVRGLTASFSWAQNNSTDAIVGFPTALPEAAAAFPSRFVRDGLGTLVAVDARPINIAQRDIESIRWGFNFSRSIGAQARAAGAQQTQQGAPPRQHGESSAAGAQAAPSLNPGGGGAGRWNLAVYHRLRLTDDLVLAPGLETIDLLDRGGLNGGGETASSIEFEGGLFYRGVGLRLNGGWTDAYATPVASGGQLNFSDRWTINARVFVNFDQRPSILEAAPFLRGGRLSLGVDNLTDSHVEVRDETGVTPTAYQEGYQSPLGRVVQLSFQKQF